MTKKEWSSFVKDTVKKYSKENIIFTKSHLLEWLCKRNRASLDEMKKEIIELKNLVHVERQEVEHDVLKEERYRCYFVYSNMRGRCYVVKFDDKIKVITAFPLGRTTLRKYKRRFK